MKFNAGLTEREKWEAEYRWHPWFAWYPVRLTGTREGCWMERIARRRPRDYMGAEWEYGDLSKREDNGK